MTNSSSDRKFPVTRMRRMRRDEFSRRLMRENLLTPDDLIWPVFIVDGAGERQPVESMPGVFRLSVDELLKEANTAAALGIPALALFPSPADDARTPDGREAWNPDGLVQARGRRTEIGPCPSSAWSATWRSDPYTTHGQDGIIDETAVMCSTTKPSERPGAPGAVTGPGRGPTFVAPSDIDRTGASAPSAAALEQEGSIHTRISGLFPQK